MATLLRHLLEDYRSKRVGLLTLDAESILDAFVDEAQFVLDSQSSILTLMEVPGLGLRLGDGTVVQLRTAPQRTMESRMSDAAHTVKTEQSMSGQPVIQAFGTDEQLAKEPKHA